MEADDGAAVGLLGVEVDALLRGLGWIERQIACTLNHPLLQLYTKGHHQVKEGRLCCLPERLKRGNNLRVVRNNHDH